MIPHFLPVTRCVANPRYADVCVHRLLAAAINVAPLPPHLSSKSYLHDLCANMNRRHRAAQLAGRASVQLHTLIFFSSDAAGKEEDAYILDVETTHNNNEPSVSVMVPRYGIEGRVKLGIAGDDPKLVRLPDQHKLVYDNTKSIQVFDRIRVKIWVREVQDYQRELVIDLVNPSFSNTDEKESRKRVHDQDKSDGMLPEKKSRRTS
jgi:exosome complex exonuclease DIS3/RRP44